MTRLVLYSECRAETAESDGIGPACRRETKTTQRTPQRPSFDTLLDVIRRFDDSWVAEIVPSYDRTGCAQGEPGRVIEDKFEIAQWAKASKSQFEKMTVDEANAVEYVRAGVRARD